MKSVQLQHGAALAIAMFLVTSSPAWAQTRPIVLQGGTLIDGTGRPAVEDAVIVFQGGLIREIGKRDEVTIPQGAEVIDAKGKSILPGLIDGHCHYRDWMGEVYLAYGVVTCPNISNNPVDWIIAQREGVRNGTIRGPRGSGPLPISSMGRRPKVPVHFGASAPASSSTVKTKRTRRCAAWWRKASTASSSSSA